MDNKELRRAAAQEFMESLDHELTENLTSESPPQRQKQALPKQTRSDRPQKQQDKSSQFTLSELEEAIEDIEHYMDQQHKPSSEN